MADVVLGLMNAYKMDMTTCLGYNINQQGAQYNLRERFRLLKIIKNRFERDNISIGLLFNNSAGTFKELPKANTISDDWINDNLKYINV